MSNIKGKWKKMSIKWGFIQENYHIFVVYFVVWFSWGENLLFFVVVFLFCCCWMNINTHFLFCLVFWVGFTPNKFHPYFHLLSPLQHSIIIFFFIVSLFPPHFTYLKFLCFLFFGCDTFENHIKWKFGGLAGGERVKMQSKFFSTFVRLWLVTLV